MMETSLLKVTKNKSDHGENDNEHETEVSSINFY